MKTPLTDTAPDRARRSATRFRHAADMLLLLSGVLFLLMDVFDMTFLYWPMWAVFAISMLLYRKRYSLTAWANGYAAGLGQSPAADREPAESNVSDTPTGCVVPR